MSILRFHFVRHAPVIGQKGVAYGRDADIDETCSALFAAAAHHLPRTDSLWIASEFPRAQKTAKILQTAMGVSFPLTITAGFNEQDFGRLAGLPKKDIVADPENAAYLAQMDVIAPPGGESVPDMMKRVDAAWSALAADMTAQGRHEAVIFCHGGVLRAARALHSKTPFTLAEKVPYLAVRRFDLEL